MSDNNTITPAALSALANALSPEGTGEDITNFIAASTPGGIEEQERAGQKELVNSTKLPKNLTQKDREVLEAWGFELGQEVDELFMEALLPDGWTRVAADHQMWSHIVDSEGRKRIGVFYKAAFYDRRANLQIHSRFSILEDYDRTNNAQALVMQVLDHDNTVLFSTDPIDISDKEFRETAKESDKAKKEAEQWLNEHRPNWDNTALSWDC